MVPAAPSDTRSGERDAMVGESAGELIAQMRATALEPV
jgi:hypothetical protein